MAGIEKKFPVLLIAFNRPDLTRLVLQSIQAYGPTQLFVACDGPRPENQLDLQLTEQVRNLFSRQNSGQELRLLFRENNLGPTLGVVSAIDWFFSHVEAGFILEDDCLPSQDFFRFAGELLQKYEEEGNVMGIGGSNPGEFGFAHEASFGFMRLAPIWGWASWRNRWATYDRELQTYVDMKQGSSSFKWPNIELKLALDWHLRQAITHKATTWDYQLSWTVLHDNKLWAVPNNSLVANIGFRADATRTRRRRSAQPEIHKLPREIRYPRKMEVDLEHERNFLHKNMRVLRPHALNVLRDFYRAVRFRLMNDHR